MQNLKIKGMYAFILKHICSTISVYVCTLGLKLLIMLYGLNGRRFGMLVQRVINFNDPLDRLTPSPVPFIIFNQRVANIIVDGAWKEGARSEKWSGIPCMLLLWMAHFY